MARAKIAHFDSLLASVCSQEWSRRAKKLGGEKAERDRDKKGDLREKGGGTAEREGDGERGREGENNDF